MKRTAEEWARAKKTSPMWFAAAKALHRWPVGRELTETEYDTAIRAAKDAPIL